MENPIPSEVPHEPGILTPEVTMVVLTWVSFLLLLVILHKFAWKPILKALDEREKNIRGAVENAERVKAELKSVQDQRDKIMNEAYAKSKEVIDQCRQAAIEAAKVIERKAKDEAHIILENARTEIRAEQERAQDDLKKEVANWTIQLTGKLVHEHLDNEKNRKLVALYTKDI